MRAAVLAMVVFVALAAGALAQRNVSGPPLYHDGAVPTDRFVDSQRALPWPVLAALAALLLALWGFVLWAGRSAKRR